MKVGIIGAGNMGSAFARRLSSAGHDVLITSRNIDDAKKVAASVGSGVRAVPQQQLAESVDVLIAATPYAQQANALGASGKLDGKAVIEISNPLKPDMSGLAVGHTTSAAEEVAKATLKSADGSALPPSPKCFAVTLGTSRWMSKRSSKGPETRPRYPLT